jgi:transcriptional regulator with XRE-family HTH domain
MRSIFAGNLRRLSSREKSHAHVARELGLNRQQFNSYVTGKNLPNERVIDNICAYFQVDVGTLFREANPETDFQNIELLTDRQRKFIERVVSTERTSTQPALTDGLYYIYFSVPEDPNLVACSLLAIRREGGLTTFRRITRLGGAAGAFHPRGRGVHSGIVLFREGRAFFIGVDLRKNTPPTFLVGRTVAFSGMIYAGQAEVTVDSGFSKVSFYVIAVSKRTKVWKAMRNVKFHQASDVPVFPDGLTQQASNRKF